MSLQSDNRKKADAMVIIAFMFLALFFVVGCSGGGGGGSDEPTPVAVVDDDVVVDTTIVKDGTEVETEALVALGELIYKDTNLSSPAGQSCASCHSPDAGFADPNQMNPSSIGADGFSFGERNAPTASYAAHIPTAQTVLRVPLNGDDPVPTLIGGQFWDGRVADLEEQAKLPFLGDVEMGNADEAEVISKIRQANYADEFEELFGADVLNDVDRSYAYVADAIAAFERTDLFSPFSSKFDRVQNGTDSFTAQELRGQQLFNGRAQCNRCHAAQDGEAELFSDFEFHNIGVPSNPLLSAFMEDPNFVDLGLGAVTNDRRDDGKFKTPTLRNVALTAPYMHNGVFTTLTEVVDFYNRRDSGFGTTPEVDRNVANGGEIGELGLSAQDVADLVAFMETMTDQ